MTRSEAHAHRQLPGDLHDLLAAYIDSCEKVELAWHLTNAGGPVSESELQQRAQMDTPGFREAIDALVRTRVIHRDGSRSLSLGPRANTPEFDALMRVYGEDRLAVIAALMSISIDRIRSMAAHTFAEAFVLRKKR